MDNTLVERIQTNDPTLTQLHFWLGNKDENDMVTLTTALHSNTFIDEISFSQCHKSIDLNSWKPIFDVLRTKHTIREVEISAQYFDFEWVKLFATTLRVNKTISTPFGCSLTHLELFNNKSFGINGVYEIVDAVCANPDRCKLTHLELIRLNEVKSSDIEMNKQIALKLALILPKLKRLDMSENFLGDIFVTIVAIYLKYSTQLEFLSLKGNGITDVGANALAKALYYNRTLDYLNLGLNDITDYGAIAVTKALRYHPTVTRFHITKNKVSTCGLEKICQFLQYNESVKAVGLDSEPPMDVETTLRWIIAIQDYNDTLSEFHTSQFHDVYGWGLCNKSISLPTPRKKGLRRRQQNYEWFYSVWIELQQQHTSLACSSLNEQQG